MSTSDENILNFDHFKKVNGEVIRVVEKTQETSKKSKKSKKKPQEPEADGYQYIDLSEMDYEDQIMFLIEENQCLMLELEKQHSKVMIYEKLINKFFKHHTPAKVAKTAKSDESDKSNK